MTMGAQSDLPSIAWKPAEGLLGLSDTLHARCGGGADVEGVVGGIGQKLNGNGQVL